MYCKKCDIHRSVLCYPYFWHISIFVISFGHLSALKESFCECFSVSLSCERGAGPSRDSHILH